MLSTGKAGRHFRDCPLTGHHTERPKSTRMTRCGSRRLYVKAKAEPSWRFWGLYVHVCKMETLRAAYEMAKRNDGAPGIDGVTFEALKAQGVEALLARLRTALIGRTYQPP